MTIRALRSPAAGVFLFVAVLMAVVGFCPSPLLAQGEPTHSEELTRKVKSKVPPIYPDIARRMNISGTVKMLVVVAPNGTVKDTKVVGGHPLLVTAAVEALKRWKFEAAPDESSGVVEFKFQPGN